MNFIIHEFAEVGSTQHEAWSLIQRGAPSGTVVRADHQTQGRGRQGRIWDSPRGNLAATLAWHLGPTERPGDYSLIVAVALHAALQDSLLPGPSLRIKWPNDLMLDDKKCAGILIESPEPRWILIGTGVNIAHAPEARAALGSFLDDRVADAPALMRRYLSSFEHWVQIYQAQGLAPVVEAWCGHAFGMGKPMTVRLPHEEFAAVFHGLDSDGACLATLPDGKMRRIYSGEVFF
jgi:BirA family transcriptional regulator, biotin operon repressor / biotin---[acetyl-CoA-carboxylase] ligase